VSNDDQPSPSEVPSYCVVCSDDSTSGDVTVVNRKSMAKYACVDCDGDRMCMDCACAHRKQRLSRDHQLIELNGKSYRCKSFCVFVNFPSVSIDRQSLRKSHIHSLGLFHILGCIDCTQCSLLLPMCAVSVRQSDRPSVCLSRGSTRLHCAKMAEQIKILLG